MQSTTYPVMTESNHSSLIEQGLSVFSLGGPVVIVLLLFSIVSLTVIVYKLGQLGFSAPGANKRIERTLKLWSAGNSNEALQAADNISGPRRPAIRYALNQLHRGAPEALVREEVQRLAAHFYTRLRTGLSTLEVIGNLSPLLGLFGTVIGMIEAFRAMENSGATVDPSVLSGGIWQALLTTGVGLAVAIPTLLAFHWLDGKTSRRFEHFEDQVTRIFTRRG